MIYQQMKSIILARWKGQTSLVSYMFFFSILFPDTFEKFEPDFKLNLLSLLSSETKVLKSEVNFSLKKTYHYVVDKLFGGNAFFYHIHEIIWQISNSWFTTVCKPKTFLWVKMNEWNNAIVLFGMLVQIFRIFHKVVVDIFINFREEFFT